MKLLFLAIAVLQAHGIYAGRIRKAPSWIDENYFRKENNSSKNEEPGPIAQLARFSERESFAVDKKLKKDYNITLPSRKNSLTKKIAELFRSKSSLK